MVGDEDMLVSLACDDEELELPWVLAEPCVSLELCVELVDPTPNATIVLPSSWPDAEMPCDCWNCFSAALVFGPALPSTGPASKPLSLSACWTWVMFAPELSDVVFAAVPCAKATALESAWGGFDRSTFEALVEAHARKRQTAEAAEGLASFAEKRAARWSRR